MRFVVVIVGFFLVYKFGVSGICALRFCVCLVAVILIVHLVKPVPFMVKHTPRARSVTATQRHCLAPKADLNL